MKIALQNSKLDDDDIIAEGSPDVFINGIPVALEGMQTAGIGLNPIKVLIEPFSTTVFVNGKRICYAEFTKAAISPDSPPIATVIDGSSDVLAE